MKNRFAQLRILCLFLAAPLVCTAVTPSLAVAQSETQIPPEPTVEKTDLAKPAPGTVKKFGSWAVTCPAAGDSTGARCYARMDVIDEKRKVAVISWVVGYNKDQKMLMDVLTPTDVLIDFGMKLTIDTSQPIKLPYISCGLNGCLSRTLIDKPTFGLLQKAKFCSLTILGTNGKEVQIKIKSNGISQAMAAIAAPRK